MQSDCLLYSYIHLYIRPKSLLLLFYQPYYTVRYIISQAMWTKPKYCTKKAASLSKSCFILCFHHKSAVRSYTSRIVFFVRRILDSPSYCFLLMTRAIFPILKRIARFFASSMISFTIPIVMTRPSVCSSPMSL